MGDHFYGTCVSSKSKVLLKIKNLCIRMVST